MRDRIFRANLASGAGDYDGGLAAAEAEDAQRFAAWQEAGLEQAFEHSDGRLSIRLRMSNVRFSKPSHTPAASGRERESKRRSDAIKLRARTLAQRR